MKHMLLGAEDKVHKPEIWQQAGYYSTDCGEENDEDDKKTVKAEKEAAAAEEEEYGEYYDEEEEAEQEETKEEGKTDPAAAIEREREELKVPDAERKLIEQMSDIEREIVARQ